MVKSICVVQHYKREPSEVLNQRSADLPGKKTQKPKTAPLQSQLNVVKLTIDQGLRASSMFPSHPNPSLQRRQTFLWPKLIFLSRKVVAYLTLLVCFIATLHPFQTSHTVKLAYWGAALGERHSLLMLHQPSLELVKKAVKARAQHKQ